MSLKSFHIFFVSVAVIFTFGFAYWAFKSPGGEAGSSNFLMGIFSGLSFLVLVPYLFWFLRKYKTLTTWAVVFSSLFFTQSAWCCSVCYGDPSSPLVQSTKIGILFLMAVIGGILATILGVGLKWAKRSQTLT